VARSFINELNRRNVFRVAIAYVVLAWLMAQVAELLLDAFGAPPWVLKSLLALLLVGFPIVVFFAWAFELTPDGVKRESEVDRERTITGHTGRKLDRAIIVLLLLALAWFAWDRYQPGGRNTAVENEPLQEVAGDTRQVNAGDAMPVVAVLPFKATGSDDGGFLAAGLHDDLLTRLAKLQAFRVISRTSMMEYADTTKNMRQIGQELGAGYILEGGVQSIGGRVRVNAQLIDASSDQHIWADNYNRELNTNNLFDVQAELAMAIAGAMQTSLSPSDLALVKDVPTENMAAYNAYLRGMREMGKPELYTGSRADHAAAAAFKEAVELDPGFAVAWALYARTQLQALQTLGSGYTTEQTESVLAALSRARALQPGMLESDLAWAEYLYRVDNDYGQALATLEALGERLMTSPEALQLSAWISRRLGRYQAGYDYLLTATRIEPRNPGLYTHLVSFALSLDACETAAGHMETLRSLAPDEPGTRVSQADYELQCTGDVTRAADLIRDIDFAGEAGWQVAFAAAWRAKDTQLALSLIHASSFYTFPQIPVWQQLNLASVYRFLEPDEPRFDQALAAAAELLEAQAQDADLAENMMFASQKSLYFAFMGDQPETLRWIEEHRRRFTAQSKGDKFNGANNLWSYAWYLTVAGLDDEAVGQLKIMLENPGGYLFPFVDKDPVIDLIRDHPGYQALRERFDNLED